MTIGNQSFANQSIAFNCDSLAPGVNSPPQLAKHDWRLLGIFLIAFAAVYIVFWPPIPGIEDEVGFVNQAFVWSHGAVSAQGANLPFVGDFVHVLGRDVPFRHPGRSLLLFPFIFSSNHPSLIFLSSLLIQLGLTIASALVFRRLALSPLFSLLVLFHPTLALFSRTVMADGAAACFVTLAVAAVLCQKPRSFLAGLCLGFAIATRLQCIVILAGVFAYLLLHKQYRNATMLGVGAAILGLPLACYNYLLFGHLSGFQFGEGYLALRYVPSNIIFDVIGLSVVWPLMLPLAILNRTKPFSLLFHLCFWPYFTLLACYHHRDSTPSLLETVVVGARLMQPVIPLLVVGYCAFTAERIGWRNLCSWIRPSRQLAGWTVIGLALLLVTGAAFRRHQAHLRQLEAAHNVIYRDFPPGSTILANSTAAKTAEVLERGRAPYQFVGLDQDGKLQELPPSGQPSRFTAIIWLSKSPNQAPPPALQQLVDDYHFRQQVSNVPGMFVWRPD